MYKQALESRQGGNWYRKCHEWIYSNFRCPELFAGLLSATSPRKSVRANYKLAKRIYNEYLSGKDYSRRGILPSHIGNIDRVLSGQELSGNKVRAFYANLTGDYNQVTIDVWMLKFYKVTDCITPLRYRKLEKRIQNYSDKVGLEPAELQAIIWNYERGKAGYRPVSFVSVATENQLMLF